MSCDIQKLIFHCTALAGLSFHTRRSQLLQTVSYLYLHLHLHLSLHLHLYLYLCKALVPETVNIIINMSFIRFT